MKKFFLLGLLAAGFLMVASVDTAQAHRRYSYRSVHRSHYGHGLFGHNVYRYRYSGYGPSYGYYYGSYNYTPYVAGYAPYGYYPVRPGFGCGR